MILRNQLIFLLLAAVPAFAEAKPSAAWYTVHHGEARIGYVHEQDAPAGPGFPEGAQKVSARMHLAIRRGDAVARVFEESVLWETDRGRILRFRNVAGLSRQYVVAEGRVRGDRLALTVTAGKQRTRRDVVWDNDVIGPSQVARLYRAHRTPGASFTYRFFSPEMQRAGTMRVSVEAREGDRVRYRSVSSLAPHVPSVEWRGPSGVIEHASVRLGKLVLTLRRATKQAALRPIGGRIPDLMDALAIRTRVALPPAGRIEAITYRVRLPAGADTAGLGGENQALLGPAENARRVRVSSRAPAVRLPAADRVRCLRAGIFVASDDPRVRVASRTAAAGATDPAAIARRCEAWVRRHVRDKGLDTLFAGAAEVLRTREGDCTEHAVLTAALCRAAGVPARVVVGYLYVRGTFLGHMWAEAYAGRWIPLDAAQPAGGHAVLRIAVARSALDDRGGANPLLDLLPGITDTDISIAAVTVGGREYATDASPSAEYRATGADMVNTLLGFRLRRPAGWRLVAQRSAMGPGEAVVIEKDGVRAALQVDPRGLRPEARLPAGYTAAAGTPSAGEGGWRSFPCTSPGGRPAVCALARRGDHLYTLTVVGPERGAVDRAAGAVTAGVTLP
jgi:transglutaminase-like putative cysteine protease